jgi:hypothetical protein
VGETIAAMTLGRRRVWGEAAPPARGGTPARTILDLAATLQRRPLERLLDQAENARLTDVASLEALARAHTGHQRAGRLLAALDTHEPGTTLTRSALEERFLALCHDHALPRPLVNHPVAGRERDFVFPAERLAVEADSWQHHHTRAAFEDDRRRDAILLRARYRTLRVTHRRLTADPHDVRGDPMRRARRLPPRGVAPRTRRP